MAYLILWQNDIIPSEMRSNLGGIDAQLLIGLDLASPMDAIEAELLSI
jgi:hypothetical protein